MPKMQQANRTGNQNLSSLWSDIAMVRTRSFFGEMGSIISFLASLHYIIIAIFLFAHIFTLITIPSLYFNVLVLYVAISLLSFPKAKQRLITPRVLESKCPICGGSLVTSQLICENCGASVNVKK